MTFLIDIFKSVFIKFFVKVLVILLMLLWVYIYIYVFYVFSFSFFSSTKFKWETLPWQITEISFYFF